MDKFPIYDYLPAGRENAVSRKQIGQAFGLTDREVREQIEVERAHGAAILSDTVRPGGYFRAANKEEISMFISSMVNRFANMSKTIVTAINERERWNEEESNNEV